MITYNLFQFYPILCIIYIILGGYWAYKHPSSYTYKILYCIPFAAFVTHAYGMAMYISLYEGYLTGIGAFMALVCVCAILSLLFNILLLFYILFLKIAGRIIHRQH